MWSVINKPETTTFPNRGVARLFAICGFTLLFARACIIQFSVFAYHFNEQYSLLLQYGNELSSCEVPVNEYQAQAMDIDNENCEITVINDQSSRYQSQNIPADNMDVDDSEDLATNEEWSPLDT